MQSVAKGNMQDLAVLFHRYKTPVYQYYMRRSKNIELSKDLTQTVFERILKYKESYKEDYLFKAWIFRIASNVYMDHFRENKMHITDLDQVNELRGEEIVEDHKDSKYTIVQKAMYKLSDTDREIIQLAKFENLKIKEVAAILDLSESAVKVRVHRIIKRLRNIVFNQNK